MDYLSIIASQLGGRENYDRGRILPDGDLENPNLRYLDLSDGDQIIVYGLNGVSRISTIADLEYLLSQRNYNLEMTRVHLKSRWGERTYVLIDLFKLFFDRKNYTVQELKNIYAFCGDRENSTEKPATPDSLIQEILDNKIDIIQSSYESDSTCMRINRDYSVNSDFPDVTFDERIQSQLVPYYPVADKVYLSELIEYQYNQIMKATEIANLEESQGQSYQYNVKAIVDLLKETTVLDLIKLDSGSYTNIVDLTQLPRTKAGEISSIVKMGVQYSKRKDKEIQVNMYSKDLSFSPFTKNSEEEITHESFQEIINNDVAVEYTNGLLRVMPATHEVIECIISYCYVIYGKL